MLFLSCAQLDSYIDRRTLASIFLLPIVLPDKYSNHRKKPGGAFRSNVLTNGIDDPALIILLISLSFSSLFEFLSSLAIRYNHPLTGIYLAYVPFLLAAVLLFWEYQNRWIRCSVLMSAKKIRKLSIIRLLRATLASLLGIALMGIGCKLLYETNTLGMLSFSLGSFITFSTINLVQAIFTARQINMERKYHSQLQNNNAP